MQRLKNVNQLWIEKSINGERVLFLLFSDDGTINRMGDGTWKDNLLCIGETKEKIFAKVRPYISMDMEGFLDGTYTSKEIRGRQCTLSIMFKSKDFEPSVRFVYGEDSEGPPEPFSLLVAKSIECTQSWYEEQLNSAKPPKRSEYKFDSEPEKPWWKLW